MQFTKRYKDFLPPAARGAPFEKTAPCSIWTPRKNFLLLYEKQKCIIIKIHNK
jgi:hypothetical protein